MIIIEIETERLILRDLEDGDLANLVEQVNNLAVSGMLALVPYPYTEKDGKLFIDQCKEASEKDPREHYDLGIVLKDGNGLIGTVGLIGVDDFESKATLGYWLGELHWGKGIMS